MQNDESTLAETAESAVRNLIADGRIEPGAMLVQTTLADRLGVSRTPLREALNRLVDDGLVERRASGGYRVRPVTAAEVAEVHEVRAHLELLAIEHSVGRHGRIDFAVFEDLLDEHEALAPDDVDGQFDCNRRFHRAVIAPCGNSYLLATIDRLWDHPVHRRITRAYVEADPGNAARMIEEHRAIVAALRHGDAALVLELSRAHLDDGYAPLTS